MKLKLFLFFFTSLVLAQSKYPKDYFRLPLAIPMQLSGCFGELRDNHFHSGFDIKTNKTEGLPVFAVAEGYVSRIKISTFGYGKAIYITHPNGITTLYGHLQRANGAIEKLIKNHQYNEKSYEIEIYLKANDLPVKKSDTIAFSGNTGGSGGPHLHFEFRDSKTDDIINPMFFGYDKYIIDTKKPTLNNLMLYPIDEDAVVNQSNMPIIAGLTLQKDGSYLSQKVLMKGKMGFGINVFDQFDNSYNKYGIYKVAVFDNGKPVFGYEFDSFSFEQFRYINALIDYNRYQKMNQRVQRLFMKNPYPLSIVKTDANNGIVEVNIPNVVKNYRIEIADFHKNTTIINVPVEYSISPAKIFAKPTTSKYLIKANRENLFVEKNVEISFPKNIFYEDFFMNFKVSGDTITLHDKTIPVHSNYTISIEDKKHSEKEMSKMFVGLLTGERVEYINTTRKGNLFTAKTRNLGTFVLTKDTIAPKIAVIKPLGKKLIDQKTLKFSISDNLSGINTYNGYINGKWILLEYEYKKNQLTHTIADKMAIDGTNNIKIEVTDNAGNTALFETIIE